MAVFEIVVAPSAAGGVELGHDHRNIACRCGFASRGSELAPAWPRVPASRVVHGYDGRRETRQLRRDAPAIAWPLNRRDTP
jgi:hypothetical protein